MTQKVKTTILVVLGLLIVWFVWAALAAPKANNVTPPQASNQPTESPATPASEPPAPPEFQNKERRFEVLLFVAGERDTYKVRDLATQAETQLFIPFDANITAGRREAVVVGTVLTAQKFMEFANGLVATDLSISTQE